MKLDTTNRGGGGKFEV